MPDWKPTASRAALRRRAEVNRVIREFFHSRNVLEVETPILSEAGNTEPNIESFVTTFGGRADSASKNRWLRTSPEFFLKRLLAAGVGDCYELGRVFRDGEAGGRHNPEFTMLEWYRTGWQLPELIEECIDLLHAVAAIDGRVESAAVHRVTYADLYFDHAGVDAFRASIDELKKPLQNIRINDQGLNRDDWLDLLMTHIIQPAMQAGEIWVVSDFPGSQAALAKVEDGLAKRFEIYWNGLEVANGYDELDDAPEQERRFGNDRQRRTERGQPLIEMDTRLLAALPSMPPCCGVAIGVDRLLMGLAETQAIADVLSFDFARS